MSILKYPHLPNRDTIKIRNMFDDHHDPADDQAVKTVHSASSVVRKNSVHPKKITLGLVKELTSESPGSEHSIDPDPPLAEDIDAPPPPELNPEDKAHLDQLAKEYHDNAMAKIQAEINAYKDSEMAAIDTLKEQTLADAKEQGYRDGREEAEASLSQQSQELLRAISDVSSEKNRVLAAAEEAILTLSLAAAEKMISETLRLTPSVCESIVKDALSRVTDMDRVTIRLHPIDAEWLRAHKQGLANYLSDIKELIIQDDAQVMQGGCIVETALGYIDSSIRTKLSSIEASLKQTKKDIENEQGSETVSLPSVPPQAPSTNDPEVDDLGSIASHPNASTPPPPLASSSEPELIDDEIEDLDFDSFDDFDDSSSNL